jgi:hypothetical protein
MRTLIKRGLTATAAVIAFGALAGSASATLVASSDPATTTSGVVELSSLSSCQSSQLTLTDPVSRAAGLGGTGVVSDASFSDCELLGSAATVTPSNLPWALNGTTAGGADFVSVTGVRVTIASGFLSCTYAGSLNGDWLSNTTASFSGASGLTKTAGGFLCPSAPTFAGDYVLDNGDTIVIS